MNNGKEKQYLVVEDSALTINQIAEEFNTSKFKQQILNSDIILLPYSGFMNYKEPLFPSVIRELYRYLNNKQKKFVVEVACEDNQHNELVQHADFVDLGKIFVSCICAPIAVNLLSNFIYDKIKANSKDLNNSIVRCELSVDKGDGNSKTFKYDGPASAFEKLLESEILSDKKLSKDGSDSNVL